MSYSIIALYGAWIIDAIVILVLAIVDLIKVIGTDDVGYCNYEHNLTPKPHSVTIAEFGMIGDSNMEDSGLLKYCLLFEVILRQRRGAQLYVPKGKYLTESFNLTSHLTLLLEEGTGIFGSQASTTINTVYPLLWLLYTSNAGI
ncbi:hypothetical protein ZIOFF_001310 [Zingiber officinale]|uniref:Polygalacturonase n=1 Tax=Zingiber officinale TaxID=94328 RepID=A0A8J5I5N8_ZINOF|nr:hypothetical protein ZIOFF_001310 [Zingiber officinale]